MARFKIGSDGVARKMVRPYAGTKTPPVKTPFKLSPTQRARLLDLLWTSLKRDPEHKDRVILLSWGTKTQDGLLACIERIIDEP